MRNSLSNVLFGIISLFLLYFANTCWASDCFKNIENADLPFEIYYGRHGIYLIQDKVKNNPSKKESPFLEYNDVKIIQLCDQNFVAVWSYSDYRSKIPLTGRIFDKQQRTLSKDFPISESFNDGWEHSVATLYDKGFVVTWKTGKNRKTGKGVDYIIRAKIFESSGKPRGNSFAVDKSKGSQGGAVVKGLPNGDFVVVWNRFNIGTYMKIFSQKGKAKTKDILVISDSDNTPYCGQSPHIYITDSGNINIFMSCDFHGVDEKYLFDCARSFDLNGKPLTSKLTDEQMVKLAGYRILVEQYVKKEAINLGFMRYLSGGIKLNQCDYGLIAQADKMKTLSDDRQMKEFFANFCTPYKELCSKANDFVRQSIEHCIKR